MSYREDLIERAEDILRAGLPLPVDLTFDLVQAGVIVEELERSIERDTQLLLPIDFYN